MRWYFYILCAFGIISLSFGVVSAENETLPVSLDTVSDSYNSGVVELEQGWNIVGIPRRLNEENNKATIFSGIDSMGRSIWTYNSDTGGWKDLTADDVLMPLDGYFVYSAKPEKIILTYTIDPLQVPPVKDLQAGWNLVGFSGATPASARDALLSIRKTWTQVIGWDPSKQQTDTTIINGGNDTHADSQMLTPMRAYWVFVDGPCSLASIGA
ncbi:MAG: hypothetical protein CVV33_07810 [Methanomicrobiales archaeon HGW-Methanomicrobiales-4]|nr:MAG: hypothetical protein CVV33_07810 [Methanomicrobiales archaeon HGW-Methanomicrobiales-4]